MRGLLCLAALVSAGVVGAAPFTGPFTFNDGITFYLVNPTGQAFDLTLRWFDDGRASFPRPTLVRVFDPDENPVARHEFPGAVAKPVPWEELKLRVEGRGKGVYQVIVVGWYRAKVEIKTQPELEFGVFGHLQWLYGSQDQFAKTFVYLPPGLSKLPIAASEQFESLALTDEAGAETLRLSRDKLEGEAALPGAGERLWQLSARGPDYRLDFKGLPIILCPSPETARAIHASVDVMPDGSICFHKHQVAAWQLLQQYRTRPRSDYDVKIASMTDLATAFLKEPARNQMLLQHYGVFALLPPLLAEQCLDPKSPWFGAIHGSKDKDHRPLTENPLADYNRLGREELAGLAKDLAAVYWMKADFNPCYHDPKLLNRVIIGVLLDQLMMREGEYVYPDNIYYHGSHGFAICHSHSGAFSLVYPLVPPEVQRVWHAGQQRLTDRFIYGTVGGCTNQWTVLLAGLWRYYEGTGEEWYREAVLRNVHWLISGELWNCGQRPAGYMTEALGPDATYNGITGHYMAYLYYQSGDPAIKESLRRAYDLFNHTIASEPDGAWLGSSGFCHRTPGDWTGPQYGAGLGPMARELPEAGVRFPDHGPWAWCFSRPAFDAASRIEAETQLRKMLSYLPEDHLDREAANPARAVGAFDILFTSWRLYSDRFLPGTLPCQQEGSFTRSLGDEFLCVKRPGYYAFLYGGQGYQTWQIGTRPKDYREQFPHNDGLCLFWSPEFGVSLLTKNWGASRANTLLATLDDGRIEWPWYWDTQSRFDADQATAQLSGQVHDTPLGYRRAYRFLGDRVECELTVSAERAVTLRGLSECVPYPRPQDKPGGLEAKLLGADGAPIANDAPARAIYWTNASGQGHLLVLDRPLPVTLGEDRSTDHYGGEHVYCRALIALPKEWAAGQAFALKYRLRPCPAARVAEALR